MPDTFIPEKIAIVGGTGPIGMEIGFKLAKTGHNVTLIGRAEYKNGEWIAGQNVKSTQQTGGIFLETPESRKKKQEKFAASRADITGNSIRKLPNTWEGAWARRIYRSEDEFLPFSPQFRVTHNQDAGIQGAFDLIISAVKRNPQQMDEALGKTLKSLARNQDTPIVVLANGIDPLFLDKMPRTVCTGEYANLDALDFATDLIKEVNTDQLIPGVLSKIGGHIEYPGEISSLFNHGQHKIALGRHAHTADIAAIFRKAGIDVVNIDTEGRQTADVRVAMLQKLVMNAVVNPLSAILGLNIGDLLKHHEPTMRAIAGEAALVSTIYGQMLHGYNSFNIDDTVNQTLAFCAQVGSHFPSMHHDVSLGLATEKATIIDALCELGKRAKFPRTSTPYLDRLQLLMDAVEQQVQHDRATGRSGINALRRDIHHRLEKAGNRFLDADFSHLPLHEGMEQLEAAKRLTPPPSRAR